jgi:hypothetical protein
MPIDPAWHILESRRLIAQTEALTRAASAQVVASRDIIAGARQILAPTRSDPYGAKNLRRPTNPIYPV